MFGNNNSFHFFPNIVNFWRNFESKKLSAKHAESQNFHVFFNIPNILMMNQGDIPIDLF